LLSLIDEILDLSKIEAGKMSIDIEQVNLNDVANDIRSLFSPLTNDKKLDFEIIMGADMNSHIKTDRMRLDQILKNLLSNAIKFTSQGKVSLSIEQQDDFITFKVMDTGIGIAADKQGLIFEAFQQEDGSTRRRFGGTGLGLSISRELSKLLGGVIDVHSIEEKGSTFSLKLPLDLEQATAITTQTKEEKRIEQPEEGSRPLTVETIPEDVDDDRASIGPDDRTILIIEDDTAFAKALLEFTRKRNYKGIIAVRGDTGIEMAKKYKPVAILLDIQLPIKDGWQVMDELKSNAITRPIPVHIMSSLEVKKESLMKGAVDFINKPVALEHMKQIFEKLEDALSRFPKKVLIVEENRQHAKALSYYLANNSINTMVAGNVDESIDALRGKEVDCVILDMGIPDKNAYNTLDTIKKIKGLENLPIIVFTGKNLSKGEESKLKQYADSIVVKTAHSYQRILDEAGLFLHLVEERSAEGSVTKSKKSIDNSEMQQVLKDKTVLIADDDIRNIFSLTKALEQHKIKVLAATDGKEALNVLKENPNVDLVLMDMMMPEMDGYESTKAIRQQQEFRTLPVIAVTAKTMVGDREKCIAAGASDYISKPVDIDQLISLLRVWLYDRS
ncbi:MAG: response regulator, partial [Sphingobacteriales bacterium]